MSSHVVAKLQSAFAPNLTKILRGPLLNDTNNAKYIQNTFYSQMLYQGENSFNTSVRIDTLRFGE